MNKSPNRSEVTNKGMTAAAGEASLEAAKGGGSGICDPKNVRPATTKYGGKVITK
jgi:hypothetical protein